MIISFGRATRCVRCKHNCCQELESFVVIKPVPWLGLRFRVCNQCADQMQAGAELKLTRIDER